MLRPVPAMTTVLIVEDDPVTSLFLRDTLAGAGFSVTAADDGAAALDVLKAAEFDLLLTDIKMPRMNGLELLEQVKSLGRPQMKIVVLTSDNTPQTLLEAVSKHADHYLTKPLAAKELVALIRGAMAT